MRSRRHPALAPTVALRALRHRPARGGVALRPAVGEGQGGPRPWPRHHGLGADLDVYAQAAAEQAEQAQGANGRLDARRRRAQRDRSRAMTRREDPGARAGRELRRRRCAPRGSQARAARVRGAARLATHEPRAKWRAVGGLEAEPRTFARSPSRSCEARCAMPARRRAGAARRVARGGAGHLAQRQGLEGHAHLDAARPSGRAHRRDVPARRRQLSAIAASMRCSSIPRAPSSCTCSTRPRAPTAS